MGRNMHPSIDFQQERPDNLTVSDTIEDILGTDEDGYEAKVIVRNGSDLDFYDLGSNTKYATETGVDYECGCAGDDGVHIVLDDDHIYRVNHTNDNISDLGALPSGLSPDMGLFDGLYYWWVSRQEIYKQLGSDTATVAFNDVGITPRFIADHNDEFVIFGQEGNSIYVFFWGKSDTDLYNKRIVINNAKLIAGGVVDGTLMLVKSVGNSSNDKERDGEIVVSTYDGENFIRKNHIKAGRRNVEYARERAVGIGDEVMFVALESNDSDHNDSLYQNYVLKIQSDGSIETQYLPGDDYGDIAIVRVAYNYTIIGQRGAGANPDRILTNESNDDDYGDYEDFGSSQYITNFLNSPFTKHKLKYVAVAFEKVFSPVDASNGEKLIIQYRVSERDDFVTLAEFTSADVAAQIDARKDQSIKDANLADDTIGLEDQVFMITKLPSGDPLPEYYEIQFDFESQKGMSIIGARYGYDYVNRNAYG